jgi:hypothetical protein
MKNLLCLIGIHPFREIVQCCDAKGRNKVFYKECIWCLKLIYVLTKPKKYHPAKWVWEKTNGRP